VQIDAGDTNQFFGCSFEGIDADGRNDPPVAVAIAEHGMLPNGTQCSGDNNNNALFGASFESVFHAVENNNSCACRPSRLLVATCVFACTRLLRCFIHVLGDTARITTMALCHSNHGLCSFMQTLIFSDIPSLTSQRIPTHLEGYSVQRIQSFTGCLRVVRAKKDL
jgi:hypothetical protein